MHRVAAQIRSLTATVRTTLEVLPRPDQRDLGPLHQCTRATARENSSSLHVHRDDECHSRVDDYDNRRVDVDR